MRAYPVAGIGGKVYVGTFSIMVLERRMHVVRDRQRRSTVIVGFSA